MSSAGSKPWCGLLSRGARPSAGRDEAILETPARSSCRARPLGYSSSEGTHVVMAARVTERQVKNLAGADLFEVHDRPWLVLGPVALGETFRLAGPARMQQDLERRVQFRSGTAHRWRRTVRCPRRADDPGCVTSTRNGAIGGCATNWLPSVSMNVRDVARCFPAAAFDVAQDRVRAVQRKPALAGGDIVAQLQRRGLVGHDVDRVGDAGSRWRGSRRCRDSPRPCACESVRARRAGRAIAGVRSRCRGTCRHRRNTHRSLPCAMARAPRLSTARLSCSRCRPRRWRRLPGSPPGSPGTRRRARLPRASPCGPMESGAGSTS